MSLLIKGGRVIDPARGIDGKADLLVVDGRIGALGKEISKDRARNATVIDARGLIVAPGFIDMHVHLREPGHEEAETIETGTAAAIAGGFTSVACMANTDPVNDERSVTEMIIAQARRANLANVFPIAAVSRGLKGEALTDIGELKAAGAVALSDDGKPVVDSELMRRALSYARTFGMTVIEHCQDPYLTKGGCMNEGYVSTVMGLGGMPNAAEAAMAYRDVELAELTGASVHIAHISTPGAAEAVRRGKARGVRVSAEVTPHHFTLTDEAVRSFDTNAKMNPPLRTSGDVRAILDAIKDGTIDCIASDHAPHHADTKKLEFDEAPFGIVGLETAVPLALHRLYHGGIVDLVRLIEMFTVNPARILGIPKGTLAPGVDADVTILDPDSPSKIDLASQRSRSKNSPFDGLSLRGRAVMTIVGGRLLHDARKAPASAAPRKRRRT
ncbi:MAG: dihydroorotase [Acidobacteriota bacterium]